MSYKMDWADEPWVFTVEYIGMTTIEDVGVVVPRCLEIAEQHPYCLMVDFTQSTGFDISLLKYQPLIQLLKHPNVRWWALVNLKGMYKFAFQILMRFGAVKLFDTQAEALAFLQEMATHIPQVQSESPAPSS